MSEMMSLEAIRLISDSLRTAVHDGTNIEAREAMLLGSLYAGLGLANAGVTAVHSLSYPLGGKYGISHGLANTIMLPRVMAFNLPGALEKFVDIAEVMGEIVDDLPLREAAYLAVEAVEALIEDCGIMTTLEELEIPETDFPELAKVAMTVARPLANNPCKMTLDEMVDCTRKRIHKITVPKGDERQREVKIMAGAELIGKEELNEIKILFETGILPVIPLTRSAKGSGRSGISRRTSPNTSGPNTP